MQVVRVHTQTRHANEHAGQSQRYATLTLQFYIELYLFINIKRDASTPRGSESLLITVFKFVSFDVQVKTKQPGHISRGRGTDHQPSSSKRMSNPRILLQALQGQAPAMHAVRCCKMIEPTGFRDFGNNQLAPHRFTHSVDATCMVSTLEFIAAHSSVSRLHT
jgi:hypothetical protein